MNNERPLEPIWSCSAAARESANLTQFKQHLIKSRGIEFADYSSLHEWSVRNIGEFWSELWDFCGVIGDKGGIDFESGSSMLDAKFFPQASINFAENILASQAKPNADALVFRAEDRVFSRTSWQELQDQVSVFAQALRAHGVKQGDRVAAYLPNIPEAVVAMLAVSSIGAIWSSCSPDFGVQGVMDRFGQIEPTLLIAVDGYFYNGKAIDNSEKLAAIAKQLESISAVIVIPFLAANSDHAFSIAGIDKAVLFDGFVSQFQPRDIEFTRLGFNHPLFILYSSGTTGAPKCIVHGVGGTLLQHLKEHRLHNEVKPGDRVFYFSTTTWMMWNWLVSGLASGATILLYDGSPFYPSPSVLFDYAETEKMTHFGTSAKYIDALKNIEYDAANTHDLSNLRVINSTGSPLAAESFDYVYESIKSDIYLASISGGTDIISCFVLGNPTENLYRGEIACKGLGMSVEVWNDDAQPVTEEKGELVCTQPFPSMPIYFWNDTSKEKYRSAYFERYDGIWAQGDYAEITANDGVIIYGRSDTTLNPGGVRIGTAEIYRQVEKISGVEEAVVIGQPWQDDVRVVLFIVLAPELVLDEELSQKIKSTIRQGASPRHVPAIIIQVADIPRTKSGKISELAVKDTVMGKAVKNTTALANPEALKHYETLKELAE